MKLQWKDFSVFLSFCPYIGSRTEIEEITYILKDKCEQICPFFDIFEQTTSETVGIDEQLLFPMATTIVNHKLFCLISIVLNMIKISKCFDTINVPMLGFQAK